jgi:MFS transporter, DHA2 family, multidrug resistance protein
MVAQRREVATHASCGDGAAARRPDACRVHVSICYRSAVSTLTVGTTKAPQGLSSISARQWLILVMVQLITLLFGMTTTLANVVLPQIKGALSATQDQIAWVVTFNLVATAVATPLTGWLAKRLGWRRFLFSAVFGFTVCSLFCAVANSLETLVLYRVGQGLFGAPIMPMGQAVLLASFPRHLHPLVMMLWGIGGVIGPVTGPIFGSMVAEAYSWRGAFLMIVPAGLAAMTCVWFALANETERGAAQFDWTGFIALSVAIATAQVMFDRGERLGWFESREILIEATVSVVAFWVFVAHSLTSQQPFLNPRLLFDRNFAVGLLIACVMGMLSIVTLVLFPGLLHDLRGYPDSMIGALLTARGIGNWFSFLIVVPLTRRVPRLTLAIGLAAQAAAGWSIAQLDINMSSFDVFWTNALQGFGFGLAYTPMTVLAFTTLPARQVTEGTGVFHLVRNFGSSLFISAAVVVLVRSTAVNYAGMSEFITPFNKALDYSSVLGSWNFATPGGLMALSGEIQRQAAMIGYINAFTLYAWTAAAAVPLAWLLRPPPRD